MRGSVARGTWIGPLCCCIELDGSLGSLVQSSHTGLNRTVSPTHSLTTPEQAIDINTRRGFEGRAWLTELKCSFVWKTVSQSGLRGVVRLLLLIVSGINQECPYVFPIHHNESTGGNLKRLHWHWHTNVFVFKWNTININLTSQSDLGILLFPAPALLC